MDDATSQAEVPSPASARSAEMRVPGQPSSVAAARTFLVRLLKGWGVHDRVIDDASLLTSELLTNAVTHGTGFVELRIRLENDRMHVAVHDNADDELPVLPPTDSMSLNGRGIRLVQSIAHDWGIDNDVGSQGKSVWFELTARPTRQQ
jgi:anti-sigma regulatory factor (Ser/Thr protein kinase)